MYAQRKVLNPQVFLEFICYVTFAVLMFYLVFTGKYQAYVTPRMVPYFYFTVAVMVIWALGGLFRLFQPQHKTRAGHCFVLAIPIVLLLLPHTPISTADLSSGYVSRNTLSALSNGATNTPAADQSINNSDDASWTGTTASDNGADFPSNIDISDTPSNGQVDMQEDEFAAGLAGLDEANRKITVSNADFGLWLDEIYTNMAKYEGYTVVMTGFVINDPELLNKDEFVPARLMMSCCVADLAPIGLLCKYDKASELENDSWVTVEGTLHVVKATTDGEEYDDPQITVKAITPAEKVDDYIYLY